MTEQEAFAFLSLEAPRHIPGTLKRRIRDAVIPRPLFAVIITVSFLIITVTSVILYFLLVPLRFGHDLLLDYGHPSTAQGTVVSVRPVPAALGAVPAVLAGFTFSDSDGKVHAGTCSFSEFSGNKGDTVRIEYFQKVPHLCRIAGSTVRPAAASYSIVTMSLFLFPLALAPFAFIELQCRRTAALLAQGRPVYGTVVDHKRSRPGLTAVHISYEAVGKRQTVRDYVVNRVAGVVRLKQQHNEQVLLAVDPCRPGRFFLMHKLTANDI